MNSFKKYCLFFLLFLFVSCTYLKGIFSPSLSLEELSVEQLMQLGLNAFQEADFDRAIEIFEYIKDAHPFSHQAIDASLKLADTFYYKRDFENAVISYQDFVNLHPKHPKIPYALYQIGLCYYHQILSIDRDQSMTKKALEMFKRIVKEHPKTRYAKMATVKIQICRQKLAMHEFYVGRFYYRTKKYKSALLRFRYILEHYDDLPIARKAQYYLELCKDKLRTKT